MHLEYLVDIHLLVIILAQMLINQRFLLPHEKRTHSRDGTGVENVQSVRDMRKAWSEYYRERVPPAFAFQVTATLNNVYHKRFCFCFCVVILIIEPP